MLELHCRLNKRFCDAAVWVCNVVRNVLHDGTPHEDDDVSRDGSRGVLHDDHNGRGRGRGRGRDHNRDHDDNRGRLHGHGDRNRDNLIKKYILI